MPGKINGVGHEKSNNQIRCSPISMRISEHRFYRFLYKIVNLKSQSQDNLAPARSSVTLPQYADAWHLPQLAHHW
jgi:hypothetical protein